WIAVFTVILTGICSAGYDDNGHTPHFFSYNLISISFLPIGFKLRKAGMALYIKFTPSNLRLDFLSSSLDKLPLKKSVASAGGSGFSAGV
ncbi:MAG TPA: hypothetical protein VM682_05200, partial [Bacillus sp. (in: firmicutes)]|nr:hypothetical protein [Bacillus sp. (in: firmicutes)]